MPTRSPPRRQYTALVLFGRESKVSVASPDTFRRLSDALAGLLGLACPEIKARGFVEAGGRKKVAPRQGNWSEALRERYVDSFGRGGFQGVELFDPMWEDDRYPDAYAAVRKHWDFGPKGVTERTDVGAENSVTIALCHDLVSDALGRLKAAAKALAPVIDCFYGSIESPIPWDQDIGDGVFEDMIDVRWHNRTDNDSGNGERRMSDGVPRLYRGNLFSRSQLTRTDPAAMAKLPGVAAVERWPNGLTYLELAKQPRYKSKSPARFADFIRFIPQD